MREDIEKIFKAKKVLQNMASGINPLNGRSIEEGSFLHDPRIIRCFNFISGILDDEIQHRLTGGRKQPERFVITPEEKQRIELPDKNIGVNEFAQCVNRVIDPNKSKRLSGVVLNRQLKKMGILSEETTPEGKTRTTTNENSHRYGIITERRNFQGNEYDMILFDAKGKEFLVQNLERIMDQ